MAQESFKRKLTAILSADVEGYSRLMAEDEEGTIRSIKAYRKLISSLTEKRHGRVVDSPGDNLLAEFTSVIDAVRCAVEVQEEISERNAKIAGNQKMEYRIGINIGDVVDEEGRIYGDGVNIAARLESLAEPGGICISGIVYSQVKNRLKLEYEYLGEQSVKNRKEPVPVYKVLLSLKVPGLTNLKDDKISPFSDKPSIAVLPFVNISGDPEQEYFSDGMTEEIIGALAKLKGLKVISRTSSFYFKGEHVDLHTVGEKLKVDNVLEGSVRKAGNKIRISAQLIKVDDDTHLWAENYNRELKDVFDIQEEISQAIVKNLRVAILGGQDERLVKDYTKNTEAYELYLKGIFYFNKGFMDFDKAIECMQKAIKADTDYVPAYAFISHIIGVKAYNGLLPPWEAKQEKVPFIERALELDDKYGSTYVQLGMHKIIEDYDWHGAERDFKRALELNPGDSSSHNIYSYYLASVGLIDEAIEEAKHAVELDPLYSFYRFTLAWFFVLDGQFDRAMEILQGTRELDPNNAWALYGLAMVLAAKGKYDEGISMLQQFRNIPVITAYLGYLYGKAGNIEQAQKILNDFLAGSKRQYFSSFMIATVYSGMGEKDKVFEWLDKAHEARDATQTFIRVHLPFYDLHSDPRWKEQMKKRGLAD